MAQQEQGFQYSRRQLLTLAGAGLATLLIPGCGGSRPQLTGLRYQVQAGDTLSGIARATGLSLRQLIAANPHLKGSSLRAGQVLLLPGVRELPQEEPVAVDVRSGPLLVQPRAVWGGAHLALKPNHDPMNGITRLTLHHTSEHPGMRGLNDREVIAKIAQYHRDVLGWADIGYHYLIGKDGKIYQGRSLLAQGAHAGSGNNGHNLGITMVGDFMHQRPSGKQAATVAAFLREQMRLYRIPMTKLLGHRDLKNTLCPGDKGYAWLQDFKSGRVA